MLCNGSNVIFESKPYTIYFIYESGSCEIKNNNDIRLVNLADLLPAE